MQTTWQDKFRIGARVLSVGGHVLRERIYSPRATTASDVPHSYLEITPEWLTAVLCKDVAGGKVLDFRTTGGSVGTSTRQGLELELNEAAREAGIPTRLFSKCTRDFTQRLLLGLAGCIGGEIGFYSKIRPHLDIEAPRGYFACVDEASWRSMILMDDIAVSKGAKFISSETYITRELIEDLLANMAKWHGYYWEHPRLKDDLAFLRTPTTYLHGIDKFLVLGDRAKVGLKRTESVVPRALLDRTDDICEALYRSFEINQRGPRTFLHGDPHIGQTYITNQGRMGFSDWQIVLQGGWAYDFAYTLTSALTVEDRRQWEGELLKYYLDRLHAAGAPLLDFDAAWLSYRQHAFYPYIVWLMTAAGGSSMTPEMQPANVCADIVGRTAHALDDLKSLKSFS